MLIFTAPFFLLLTGASSKTLRMAVQRPVPESLGEEIGLRNDKLRDKMDFGFYGGTYWKWLYLAQIGIGNPPQNFTIVFEPNFDDFWVTSSQCPPREKACVSRQKYDSSKSFTYIPDGRPASFSFSFMKGSGFRSMDNIYVGGIEVADQLFIESTRLSNNFLYGNINGVIGLSFNNYSDNGYVSPLHNMYHQGFIDSLKFSMYLTQYQGEIIFGASDPGYYIGELNYVPVVSDSQWVINIESIEIGSKELCGIVCNGFFYSNTPFIRPPRVAYEIILRELKARRGHNNWNTISCSNILNLPTLKFYIGGILYTMTPEDYIKDDMTQGNTCYLLFRDNNYGFLDDYWVIGNHFMRKYYIEFDIANKRIGIAEAIEPEMYNN